VIFANSLSVGPSFLVTKRTFSVPATSPTTTWYAGAWVLAYSLINAININLLVLPKKAVDSEYPFSGSGF
jgi:hypothetical protein